MADAFTPRSPLTALPAWRALTEHVGQVRDAHLRSLDPYVSRWASTQAAITSMAVELRLAWAHPLSE